MNHELPIEVFPVEKEEDHILWPKDLPEDVYTLVYTHSELQLNKGYKKLPEQLLYEAWAFDGKKSWHLWKRDHEWVCTVYDTTKDEQDDAIRTEQLLMKQFAHSMKKSKLAIYERIAYDSDEQAYIAYSCPIDLV